MTTWKDVLCLLAIFVAYGLAGHLDYQDAVAMEEAMRGDTPPPCLAPYDATAERATSLATVVTPKRPGSTDVADAVFAPACVPDHE